jgi:hypothetical protein
MTFNENQILTIKGLTADCERAADRLENADKWYEVRNDCVLAFRELGDGFACLIAENEDE